MTVLIIMLVIPTLGLLMWWADHARRYGLDADVRETSRTWLSLLGMTGMATAVPIAAWSCLRLYEEGFSPIWILWGGIQAIVVITLALTGLAAYRVSQHFPRDELTLQELSRRDREQSRLTIGILVMTILPLFIPGSFVLMLCGGLVGAEFAIFSILRRARENRMLWTLALAARQDSPFPNELEALAMNESKIWASRLRSIANSIRNGNPLSTALMTGGNTLPTDTAATIRAGENHGTLPQTLGELAIDHSRRMKWFQQDSALNNTVMYAWMVTTVFVFVSGFIMYWIVPKYKEIFNDFGVELPRVTNSFVHLADWFVNYWYLLIPAMGTPFVIIYGLIAIGAGQYRRLPGFLYGVWPRLTTPSILRSLSGVATAGEPMAQLLRDLADTAPSWQLMSRYDRIRRRVEGGEQLPIALQLEGVINLREMAALDHATHVGHLPWALTAIADRIEDLRHRRIRTVIEILKPFTILFVGLLVFLFCVSMFLPLVKLLNDLS